jgi:hypothetical protein
VEWRGAGDDEACGPRPGIAIENPLCCFNHQQGTAGLTCMTPSLRAMKH